MCFFFFGNVKGVKDESRKKKTCVSEREREREKTESGNAVGETRNGNMSTQQNEKETDTN